MHVRKVKVSFNTTLLCRRFEYSVIKQEHSTVWAYVAHLGEIGGAGQGRAWYSVMVYAVSNSIFGMISGRVKR